MDYLPDGIYDQLITLTGERQLKELPESHRALTARLVPSDLGLIGQFIQNELETKLQGLKTEAQLAVANRVLAAIHADDPGAELTGFVLRAVLPQSAGDNVVRPDTSIAENAIFTAGEQQLSLGPQLVSEIRSANEVYLLVSFIRQSGLDILWTALSELAGRGGRLHVLTSTYMGITQIETLDRLAGLQGADVRVSLDGRSTRLHAKSYLFLRDSGFHTAYVGSSNISNPALTDGLEWNVKIASAASPVVFDIIRETCEAYRHSTQFELYGPESREQIASALKYAKVPNPPTGSGVVVTIKPFRYQTEILDRLQAERELHDCWRNLIVAATGTGKTAIAALDYARYYRTHDRARLLFVAHREEILAQARKTFRGALGDPHFGSLQVGTHHAESLDHLFISVQTLNRRRLWDVISPDFYDYIVIDEAHHIAAQSYRKAVRHFEPEILLGLTATPERNDKKGILDMFDGRIAAEIRLPQAIDQGLLCPFTFFGLDDTVDLDHVRWTRGGYDTAELEGLYVNDAAVANRRAEHIITETRRLVDTEEMRALGFCVSVAHAEFMARVFNRHGIRAAVITGATDHSERHRLRHELENGDLAIIFCVDVFNEGVDIPCLDTILLLRPTESLTVFVQQLGRGLRLYEGKDRLLVMDFIGNANRNYRIEEQFRALLRANANMTTEVLTGFTHVPRGCYIELQEKPMKVVLQSIERSFGTSGALVARVKQFVVETGTVPTLSQFLSYYHLPPQRLYASTTFDALLRTAGYEDGPVEPLERQRSNLADAFLRLSYIDSVRWLRQVGQLLDRTTLQWNSLALEDELMLRMLITSIWPNDELTSLDDQNTQAKWKLLEQSPRLLAELRELFAYRAQHVDVLGVPINLGAACPLEVYCTYTRNQLLAAVRYSNPRGMQSGVLWVPELNADLLLVTVRKQATQYEPTTMYQDYAIDSHEFHWQTQSDTDTASAVGQRYIHHKERGSHVILCVREERDSIYGGRAPYQVLGPVEYVSSCGTRPMSIVWRLQYEMDPEAVARFSRVTV